MYTEYPTRDGFSWFEEFIEQLRPLDKVLVTGPQRSGTRFCAQIISKELGIPYIDEAIINVDDVEKVFEYINSTKRFVLQCPGLSWCCHYFSTDDIGVVFMLRNIEDIIKSQNRINWEWESYELGKYKLLSGVISMVKQDTWNEQQDKITNAFGVHYEGLKEHPDFVSKHNRLHTLANETQVSGFQVL